MFTTGRRFIIYVFNFLNKNATEIQKARNGFGFRRPQEKFMLMIVYSALGGLINVLSVNIFLSKVLHKVFLH